jgi:hypothetical protein
MISQHFQRPSRWAWILPVVATAAIVACESGLAGGIQNQYWGFVTVNALKSTSGTYRTSPEGMFFIGRLSSVPNAGLVLDSCTNGLFTGSGNQLNGVTFLDAGSPVTTRLGARLDTLTRVTGTTNTIYVKPNGETVPYTPGDSIVATVPGAVGGFPASTIRAKTAEAFTADAVPVPTGTDAIQLRWTRGADLQSAMIVELRYNPSGGATPTKELLCSYTDDGIDSIPFRQHQPWSASGVSAREVVFTRLRTAFVAIPNGLLEVISTFQLPTPAVP